MTFSREAYEYFLHMASEELDDLNSWICWQKANCPFEIPKEIQRYIDVTVVNLVEDIARYRAHLP